MTLGHVTQEMNKLKVVLDYGNPEIISFQMICGFFIYISISNFTPNFGMPLSILENAKIVAQQKVKVTQHAA